MPTLTRIAIDANILPILFLIDRLPDLQLDPIRFEQRLNRIRGGKHIALDSFRRLWSCFLLAQHRLITVGCLVEADNLLETRVWDQKEVYVERKRLEQFVVKYQLFVVGPNGDHGFQHASFAETFRSVGYSDALLIFAARDNNCAVLSDDQRRFPDKCYEHRVKCYSIETLSTGA